MCWISMVLFALSANLDNLVIGAAYGLKRVKIRLLNALIITAMTSIGTLVAMNVGKGMVSLIPDRLADKLGGGIIICMGVFCLITFFKNRWYKRNDIDAERVEGKEVGLEVSEIEEMNLSHMQAMVLSFALMLNNMGLGIGASMSGMNIFMTTVISFLFSFILLYIGNRAGNKRVSIFAGRFAEPASGMIIIFLGILELIF